MKTFSISLSFTLLLFAAFLLYDSAIPAQSEKNSISRRNGKEVIEKAIEQFQTIKTINSRVLLKSHFFGEEYSGDGFYSEKRFPTVQESDVSPNRFLFTIKFQFPSSLENSSSTQKVLVDGSYFDKFIMIGNEGHRERVDLKKLQEILSKSQKNTQRNGGSTNQSQPVGLGELTSLGGLEGTLIQIARYYDFNSATVENATLGSENLAVWKVSAKLKPDKLKAMVESYGGDKVVAKHGGGHIPSAVTLYFGKEDLFPYRICYYGGVKENLFHDQPSIDLEYRNVSINGDDIPTKLFDIGDTGNTVLNDVTEKYADRLLDEKPSL